MHPLAHTGCTMPRDLQFNRDSALDQALNQFWIHGFNDTSMRDLAETLGVSLSSLYNTFGDKRALYLEALGHYDSLYLTARLGTLERSYPPLEGIKVFFETVIQDCLSDPDKKGCFLVNTALELSPHDDIIEAKVRKHLDVIESFLLGALKRAKKARVLSTTVIPKDLAAQFMATLLGIRVMARANPDARKLRAVLAGTLAHLVR